MVFEVGLEEILVFWMDLVSGLSCGLTFWCWLGVDGTEVGQS